MADFNSSLPVRTQTDGDIVAKLTDGVLNLSFATEAATAPASGILSFGWDGTDAYALSTDTNGYLNVNIMSGAGGTTDTDDDSIATGQTASLTLNLLYGYDGTSWERLHSDTSGNLHVKVNQPLPTGTNSIGTVGLDAGTNNIGDIGTIVDLEATDGAAALTKGIQAMGTDGTNSQTLSTDNTGALNVIQKAGEVFEVHITENTSSGEVHSYEVETAVASNASSNHIYTVTAAKTLLLRSVQASGSGKGKVEVQVGPSGSEVTKAVGFWSASEQMIQIMFPKPIEVAATDTVKLILTNRDNQTQDLYSFINGEEIG